MLFTKFFIDSVRIQEDPAASKIQFGVWMVNVRSGDIKAVHYGISDFTEIKSIWNTCEPEQYHERYFLGLIEGYAIFEDQKKYNTYKKHKTIAIVIKVLHAQ